MILMLLLCLGGPLGWGLLGACAQALSSRSSDSRSPRPPGVWRAEAEDTGRDPTGRNWCSYQKSRLVTFIAACKTEKFLVHSQQPCPQGAPDCQRVKVMYRVAHKPLYQVKQKVLVSTEWRCCPGFAGPDCQHHDPTGVPEPADPGDGLQEPWDNPHGLEPGAPAAEISNTVVEQEGLLGDLQNDIHEVADSLPGPWKSLEGNFTAATTEANQTELEFSGTSLEHVLPSHIDAFLQVHFSPVWRSLNQSLHSLSQAIRNLSLDVEANRQAIKRVQESTVARADFQELGAKFETKVQENAQRVAQLRLDVEELQVNHTALRELRVILMERSLIMEENKEEMERQLLELNLTLQHLQGGHADLIKYVRDCNCQKLSFDLDVIREGQRDTTRALEETQVSLDERRRLDGSSLEALSSAVAAVSRAQEEQREEAERARADAARLRSQLRTLGGEASALRAAEAEMRGELGRLHGSFAALLEDALRHEAVLAALFGEEALEEMSEAAPGPLPLSYEQIRVGLRDAASGLQEQALGWDALAARVDALEQAARRPEPGEAAELARELQRLGPAVQQAARCCEASWAASLNGSVEGLQGALAATERGLEQHERLFHSLFGNFQGLVAANVSLDLGKLQAMLSRKEKKQRKGLEASRRRDRKQADAQVQGPVLWEAGSPVAFYASLSEGTAALQTVKFNATYVNTGGSYFAEHGYFRAPERGVYFFAVSIEFGPGPGAGQLVFGGHHRTPVCTSAEQRDGGTATTFAMAELQKGERVWFEVTQGSVIKRSPSGTAFGGFLMFKT
uniref:Multimerin-2 n=1 Tax=Equus caballus TaxID=9796 RepID=A0A3Q2LDR3_HORSE